MKSRAPWLLAGVLLLFTGSTILESAAEARGGRMGGMGRGGFGGRGGGGFSRMSRPPSRPSRPATRPSDRARPASDADTLQGFNRSADPGWDAGQRPGRPANLPAPGTDPGAGRPDLGRPGQPDLGQPGRPDLGQPGRPRPLPPPVPVGGWGPYWGWEDWDHYYWGYDDWDDDEFAVGLVAGAAAGTAAADDDEDVQVGTTVLVLPAGCSAMLTGGVTYYQCGPAWYQPQFVGTTVQYTVVPAPTGAVP